MAPYQAFHGLVLKDSCNNNSLWSYNIAYFRHSKMTVGLCKTPGSSEFTPCGPHKLNRALVVSKTELDSRGYQGKKDVPDLSLKFAALE